MASTLNLIDEACNMSRHYFVSKFLKEKSIIIVLISCLSFYASRSPKFARIYYQFIIKKVYEEINEIPRLQIL